MEGSNAKLDGTDKTPPAGRVEDELCNGDDEKACNDGEGQQQLGETSTNDEPNDGEGQQRLEETSTNDEPNDGEGQQRLEETSTNDELSDVEGQQQLDDTSTNDEPNDGEGQQRLEETSTNDEPNDGEGQQRLDDTSTNDEPNDGEGQQWLEETSTNDELSDGESQQQLEDTLKNDEGQQQLEDTLKNDEGQQQLEDTLKNDEGQQQLEDTLKNDEGQQRLENTLTNEELNDGEGQQQLKNTLTNDELKAMQEVYETSDSASQSDDQLLEVETEEEVELQAENHQDGDDLPGKDDPKLTQMEVSVNLEKFDALVLNALDEHKFVFLKAFDKMEKCSLQDLTKSGGFKDDDDDSVASDDSLVGLNRALKSLTRKALIQTKMLEQAQASKLKLAKKEKSPKRNLRSGTGVVSRGKPDNYGYENKDNKEKARGRKTRAAAAKAKWIISAAAAIDGLSGMESDDEDQKMVRGSGSKRDVDFVGIPSSLSPSSDSLEGIEESDPDNYVIPAKKQRVLRTRKVRAPVDVVLDSTDDDDDLEGKCSGKTTETPEDEDM